MSAGQTDISRAREEAKKRKSSSEVTIPTMYLPPKFVDYCKHVAEVRHVPTEYVLMTAIVTAGVAAGSYAECFIDGYYNKPGINLLVVAPSGAGKSQPMEDIMQPIKAIDRELLAIYDSKLKEWRAANTKKSNPEPRPPKTQIICHAETDAARIEFVCDNPRGGVYYKDELRAFFKTLTGKFNATGMELFIDISDFKGIKIDTKGQDEIKVCKSSFRPVMGGIQPHLIEKTFTSDHIINGILHRFEVVMFEGNDLPTFGDQKGIDPDKAAYWERIVKNLRSIGNPVGESNVWTYRLTPEAKAAYLDCGEKLTALMQKNPNDTPQAAAFRTGAYNKIKPTIHRLALIAHLLKMADETPGYPHTRYDIGADSIRWAFSAVPYLLRNKLKVYDLASGKPKLRTDAEIIRDLAAAIRKKGRQLNQSLLAEATGISRPNINAYINGSKEGV